MKQIASALLEAQKEMGNPIKGRTNPFFRNRYADLNAVREAVIPVLNKYSITVLQPMVHIEGRNFVKTLLLHKSGETIESLTEIIYAKTNDAQAHGSGITYARRYGLQSLVCVGADDDDGNSASNPKAAIPTLDEAINEAKNANSSKELYEVWAKYKGYFATEQDFTDVIANNQNNPKKQ